MADPVIPKPTQAQLDALAAIIYTPEFALTKQATFADQSFTFRSVDEAERWLSMMQRSIGGNRTRYVVTSKGA